MHAQRYMGCFPRTNKMKISDILQILNIVEHWLINSIMSQKSKYFGHIKCHSDLERTVMVGVVRKR